MVMNATLAGDPRSFQIAALTLLLCIGVGALHLPLDPVIALTIVATAIFTQRLSFSESRDPKSALISALSLCLLLRTNDPVLAAAAAALAIASKALIRFDGRHVFNPSAFALVVITCAFDGAWISPGQWGHAMLLGIAVAAAGSVVTSRAARFDTSVAFLAAFAGIVVTRGLYLGDPFALMVHQLNNGALLIFAFFMISDPRTTPLHRGARIAFAVAVALAAGAIEFLLYKPNGAIFALIIGAPLVPLFNRLWPEPRARTGRTMSSSRRRSHIQGDHHAYH